MQRVLAHRVALGFVIAGAALGGCEEEAPRFDAPHASGVLTLPLRESQRFDAKMTTVGLYAALQGSHASIEVGSLGESRKVLLAHVPKGRFEPVMLGVENTALDALIDGGYTLVIGSGFVSVFDPVSPLGLLQLNGEVVSEVTPHGYTRILGVSEGMLRIVGRADYHPGLFESAIQVGPGVVEGGKLDIRPGERELQAHIRAFVTTCEDRWLVGVARKSPCISTTSAVCWSRCSRKPVSPATRWSISRATGRRSSRSEATTARASPTSAIRGCQRRPSSPSANGSDPI